MRRHLSVATLSVTTLSAAASSALAAAALIAVPGTAAAQEQFCIPIENYTGTPRCMVIDPAAPVAPGSLGYGSFGTGSLADLLAGVINAGSTTLSLDIPIATGSYAPGSFGSYGPEAAIGQLFVGSLGSLAGAS